MNIRNFVKKLLSMALCLCMALSLLPVTALADTGSVAYLDDKGKAQTYTGDYTTVTSTATEWGIANTTKWYVLSGDVKVTSRITVSGTVNLILTDGCTLTVNNGINVSSGQALTIYGQTAGTGTVTVWGGYAQAGIGSYVDDGGCGTITINGGTVTANGGSCSPGIGIGSDGGGVGGGTITINGGSVTAIGDGAGIGGGYSCSGGEITITDGSVTATGTGGGAGIGGGVGADGGTITITGGSVTAIGDGAGIGGGHSGSGGTITITGGSVTATGGENDAGIGGGRKSYSIAGDGGTITITGGSIQASGGSGASAIGKGNGGTSNGTVTVAPAVGNTITVKTNKASLAAAQAATGTAYHNPDNFTYSSVGTASNRYAVIKTISKLNTPLNLTWGSGANAGVAS